MIQIVHVDRLEERLRHVPAVVDAQHRRDARFTERLLTWLCRTEEAMTDAHLASVSQVAALRSRLLTALHRSDPVDGQRQGRRKHSEHVASDVLQRAQQVLTDALEPQLERLREAESIAVRVVAVARAKGVLAQAAAIEDHQQALGFVQAYLCRDPDTAAATVHLTGVLGPIDSLVMLDRALPDLAATAPREEVES